MYKRGPWSGDKGLQNVKAFFLFCQHASDLQQVDTLPTKNIEIPIEKEEVLCVFIADFGQINASFFSKQDMCLSETDTDMFEIATNEARVMSTKNEACNDQLLPGSLKKKKTCGIPAAFECWLAGKQNRRPPRRPVMIRHVMLLPKSKAAKAAGWAQASAAPLHNSQQNSRSWMAQVPG